MKKTIDWKRNRIRGENVSKEGGCEPAFILEANKTQLTLVRREVVTSGSVNVYTVHFEFSDDWSGLEKTVVFRAGTESRSVLLDDSGETSIPWEVLVKPDLHLTCGVYGAKGGDTVLPTIWADMGVIWRGAELAEDEAQPPTPGIWQQRLDTKADGLEYDGLNLSLMSGEKPLSTVQIAGVGGEKSTPVPGPVGKDGVSPTVEAVQTEDGTKVTITDVNGEHSFEVLNGRNGEQGPQGEEGKPGEAGDPGDVWVPSVNGEGDLSWVKNSDTPPVIVNIRGPKGDSGAEGPQGIQGVKGDTGDRGPEGMSPTVTTRKIDNGTEVTITDSEQAHVFNVLNGKDGAQAENYSLDEIKIGTWIDGRPLYRKVYKANTPAKAGTYAVVLRLEERIFPINIYGIVCTSYDIAENTMTLPIYYSHSDIDHITLHYEAKDNTVNMGTGASYCENLPCYIIFEYTKAETWK